MSSAIATACQTLGPVRQFVDEQTGRVIRQLTDFKAGAHLGYFRMFRHLPDGRMLGWARHDHGHAILIEPASGEIELLPGRFWSLKLRESDGRNWYVQSESPEASDPAGKRRPAQLWHVDLPDGQPVLDAVIADDLPGVVEDITIDGQYLILRETNQDLTACPIPTTHDVESINRYFSRPRDGAIWTYHIASGRTECIFRSSAVCPLHLDTSPVDPTLLRYCMDMPETQGQRIWTSRIDGSERRAIRPQARGELVTHEFWWADGKQIGYTYQDRRNDPTVLTHHWAEYALADTRLGIADPLGREVYLSDPLNCYHTHLYRSSDGRLICGEGTERHSHVYAATFSTCSTRIDMIPLATVHTRYVPFRGQGVDCSFSADGRWLIYADKLDDSLPHQLFAVAVDL